MKLDRRGCLGGAGPLGLDTTSCVHDGAVSPESPPSSNSLLSANDAPDNAIAEGESPSRTLRHFTEEALPQPNDLGVSARVLRTLASYGTSLEQFGCEVAPSEAEADATGNEEGGDMVAVGKDSEHVEDNRQLARFYEKIEKRPGFANGDVGQDFETRGCIDAYGAETCAEGNLHAVEGGSDRNATQDGNDSAHGLASESSAGGGRHAPVAPLSEELDPPLLTPSSFFAWSDNNIGKKGDD